MESVALRAGFKRRFASLTKTREREKGEMRREKKTCFIKGKALNSLTLNTIPGVFQI